MERYSFPECEFNPSVAASHLRGPRKFFESAAHGSITPVCDILMSPLSLLQRGLEGQTTGPRRRHLGSRHGPIQVMSYS